MNALSMQEKVTVITALTEGNSIRSIERMTGIHRDTICRLLVSTGASCAALMNLRMRNLKTRYLQIDEIWTFVGKKRRNVREGDSPEIGDQWVFVALDAESKLVPAFLVGKRHREDADLFLRDLYQRIYARTQITTDGLSHYTDGVPAAFGLDVDFAQLVKLFGEWSIESGADTRYSPPKITEVISKVRIGDPDPDQISTSFVERQNLTMRMQMRRFTRLTNAFSKKVENLKAAVALHFAHYNFCRIHGSLRTTPAMAAGISSSIWSVEQLLSWAN
jgi:IS1 family transposase